MNASEPWNGYQRLWRGASPLANLWWIRRSRSSCKVLCNYKKNMIVWPTCSRNNDDNWFNWSSFLSTVSPQTMWTSSPFFQTYRSGWLMGSAGFPVQQTGSSESDSFHRCRFQRTKQSLKGFFWEWNHAQYHAHYKSQVLLQFEQGFKLQSSFCTIWCNCESGVPSSWHIAAEAQESRMTGQGRGLHDDT